MQSARLEHVNITVSDPHRTAAMLKQLCGWDIRWEGPAMNSGYTVHVGSEVAYVALYGRPGVDIDALEQTTLNHVGLLVSDLDRAMDTVRSQGHEPYHLSDYEPGRRFYFRDADNIEFEVISYE